MQSLLVTVNRAAGTADDVAVETALKALLQGADVTVAARSDEAELVEVLADRGNRRLVVIGGDGSMHAAVNALDRVGRLGPVTTSGSGPEPPPKRCGSRAGSAPRPSRWRGGRRGDQQRSRPPGGGRRRRRHPRGGRLDADGSTGVLMLGVRNGPTIAGGTPWLPARSSMTGWLTWSCTAKGPLARAAFAAALVTGSHGDRHDVWMGRGRQAPFRGPPTEISADGELQVAIESRTRSVEHHAWSVLVPS
jgi:diacylglycerol kinase family enzyme